MNSKQKKSHGVFYTPRWLVDLILDEAGFDGRWGTLLDPACGDGAFLAVTAERIISGGGNKESLKKRLQNDICGADISGNALAACKQRLTAIAARAGLGEISWRLRQCDILAPKAAEDWREYFDFVVGNPPYVRIQHLGEARRVALRQNWRLCADGNTDIYIAFFEMGLQSLKDGGHLGFITPNTWASTRAGHGLRRFLLREKIARTLVDFEHEQLFEDATIYCLITILQKGIKRSAFSLQKGNAAGQIRRLGDVPLAAMSEERWTLCAPADLQRLQAMKKGRVPLSSLARIHVGLTTLADRCYIFERPRIEGKTALITHPISMQPARIERALLRPIIKASVLKSGEEEQNRHILFPYVKIGGRHRLISEQKLENDYPLAYAYLRSVKPLLDARDRGRANPAGWYAFGRSQGLDTCFGEKILTSPMNLSPNFIVWRKPEYAFYSGYCLKFDGDLDWLANQLNSQEMDFYINAVSRRYQHGWKSFAKSFLQNFPAPPPAGVNPSQMITPSLFG